MLTELCGNPPHPLGLSTYPPSNPVTRQRVLLSPFEERLLLLSAAIFKVMIPCLSETLFPLASSSAAMNDNCSLKFLITATKKE